MKVLLGESYVERKSAGATVTPVRNIDGLIVYAYPDGSMHKLKKGAFLKRFRVNKAPVEVEVVFLRRTAGSRKYGVKVGV